MSLLDSVGTVALIGISAWALRLAYLLDSARDLIDVLDNENKKQYTAIRGLQARLYSETLRSKQD